jgi:molybdopterin converting factor small subunit
MSNRSEHTSGKESDAQPRAVTIAVFGPLTEIFDGGALEVELTLPATAAGLDAELRRRRPELDGRRYQIAADERIVRGEELIDAGVGEIALLPPFAGG